MQTSQEHKITPPPHPRREGPKTALVRMIMSRDTPTSKFGSWQIHLILRAPGDNNILHYIMLHYITLRYTTLYCIILHYTTLYCIITLHYIASHHIELHYIILHDNIASCYIACVALYLPFYRITLHRIILHCTACFVFTSHGITLDHLAFIALHVSFRFIIIHLNS